jgi:hypothetical protein
VLERKSAWQRRKNARYGAHVIPLLPPDVASRRARAAVEYAPYDREEIQRRAEKLNARLTPATFNRITSLTSPRGFNNTDELEAFAAACEVPPWFLEVGFTDQEDDRLSQIEAVLGVVVTSLSLERLDADEAQVLERWRQRSEQRSGEEQRESRNREAE